MTEPATTAAFFKAIRKFLAFSYSAYVALRNYIFFQYNIFHRKNAFDWKGNDVGRHARIMPNSHIVY